VAIVGTTFVMLLVTILPDMVLAVVDP